MGELFSILGISLLCRERGIHLYLIGWLWEVEQIPCEVLVHKYVFSKHPPLLFLLLLLKILSLLFIIISLFNFIIIMRFLFNLTQLRYTKQCLRRDQDFQQRPTAQSLPSVLRKFEWVKDKDCNHNNKKTNHNAKISTKISTGKAELQIESLPSSPLR